MTPTDRTELRRLATAAKKYGFNNHRVGDFRVAASPDVVLALIDRLAEVEKDGRAIRRMLCVSVAHMPYMDDGEASDQEIDFLRDSPADIEKKLMERNWKKYAAMKEQA